MIVGWTGNWWIIVNCGGLHCSMAMIGFKLTSIHCQGWHLRQPATHQADKCERMGKESDRECKLTNTISSIQKTKNKKHMYKQATSASIRKANCRWGISVQEGWVLMRRYHTSNLWLLFFNRIVRVNEIEWCRAIRPYSHNHKTIAMYLENVHALNHHRFFVAQWLAGIVDSFGIRKFAKYWLKPLHICHHNDANNNAIEIRIRIKSTNTYKTKFSKFTMSNLVDGEKWIGG